MAKDKDELTPMMKAIKAVHSATSSASTSPDDLERQRAGQGVAAGRGPVAIPVERQRVGLFQQLHVVGVNVAVAVLVRDAPPVVAQRHPVLRGTAGIARVVGIGVAAFLPHGKGKGAPENVFPAHAVLLCRVFSVCNAKHCKPYGLSFRGKNAVFPLTLGRAALCAASRSAFFKGKTRYLF